MEDKKDHIKEYFTQVEANKENVNARELFGATKENIDLKTELEGEEIVLINKLMFNDKVLQECQLDPVFFPVLNQYMRLKVSFKRKSRQEFVNINRANNTDEVMSGLQGVANLSNITKTKQ